MRVGNIFVGILTTVGVWITLSVWITLITHADVTGLSLTLAISAVVGFVAARTS